MLSETAQRIDAAAQQIAAPALLPDAALAGTDNILNALAAPVLSASGALVETVPFARTAALAADVGESFLGVAAGPGSILATAAAPVASITAQLADVPPVVKRSARLWQHSTRRSPRQQT